jgi:hypothetical protein
MRSCHVLAIAMNSLGRSPTQATLLRFDQEKKSPTGRTFSS